MCGLSIGMQQGEEGDTTVYEQKGIMASGYHRALGTHENDLWEHIQNITLQSSYEQEGGRERSTLEFQNRCVGAIPNFFNYKCRGQKKYLMNEKRYLSHYLQRLDC